MTHGKSLSIWIAAIVLIGLGINLMLGKETQEPVGNAKPVTRPALSVGVVQPTHLDMPLTLTVNGSVAAWQEAIIGAQVSDLRLDEVHVQVGEKVRKGQVLAAFAKESVLAEVTQSKANLAEAEANLAEARLNADRASEVASSGALSKQQVMQYLTAEKTAKAKVGSAKAQLDSQLLRLSHTHVIAIDDGVISSRTATLGAVATPGQELFRLIRQNRLEWRAEVTAAEMAQIKPDTDVSIAVPNVGHVNGKVRFLAPTLDAQSRNGLIYVDLPNAAASGLRAGMFAQGEFHLGNKPTWTIPQGALSLREGFSYVFRLTEQSIDQAKVTQVKVQLGRRSGDNYEVLSGLMPEDKIVASGAAFLADGDSVRVVQK
jgi:RND family efflux transporter MFP subunit